MKIVRYFIQGEWEDMGLLGFQALWVPKSSTFNPTNATGMVHDMLEHRLCDRGHLHEEAMALGRVIALRIESGVFLSSAYALSQPESGLGAEFGRVWQEDNGYMEQAPEVNYLDTWAEASVARLALAARREIQSDGGQVTLEELHNFEHWMRLGYRDAHRRYKRVDDTGITAFDWAKRNTDRIENLAEDCPGSVLRLCWDTERFTMTDTLIEPKDGSFPEWLRHRIWHWNTDRV